MNQKGFAPILIVLFLAAAIGGYFIYQNNIKPTPSETTQTQVDETSNWKTYTNTKYGYSFKYPSDLSVSGCSNSCGESLFYPKFPGDITQDGENGLGNLGLIGFNQCEKDLFSNSTDFKKASLQAQCDLPGVSSVNDPIMPVVDEKTIKNTNGLSQYSFYLQTYDDPKIGPFSAFFFSNPIVETDINGDAVTRYGVYWSPNQFKPLTSDQMDLLNQIIATFKFTDQNAEGKFCGGIAGITCPSGYSCELDGNYPDAGGKCIKN